MQSKLILEWLLKVLHQQRDPNAIMLPAQWGIAQGHMVNLTF